MANPDRLTGLDTSFLHLERDSAHMHVAGCMLFEGETPDHEQLIRMIEARLHLVPRYRQRLAFVPLNQGRPVWVDDPHFNAGYHIRHTALPAPGGEAELQRLAGRVFSQELDRAKPLWEIWLVDGLAPSADGTPRFALLSKTHHALVDGISGVDITTVLFDTSPEPQPIPEPPEPWVPRPLPSGAQLLADALLERATLPSEILRGLRALTRTPRRILGQIAEDATALASALAGATGAPETPFNVKIGPHRRFVWLRTDLDRFKAIKSGLGGTVNDVVLSAVSLALGRYLRDRGLPTQGLVLRAMVPVSVRADVERGALGNRVASMWAPLPVGEPDPAETFKLVHAAMADLKSSGQAVGAEVLTSLADFAPPTIMAQAARLQARQRFFNLVVTNVPGPQFPLYLLGRRMLDLFPMVPLAANQALGIAIMSYDGQLHFGLNADYDALPDVQDIAVDLESAIDGLAAAAGLDGASDGNGHAPLGFEMPRTRTTARTSKRRPRAQASAKSPGPRSGD